MKRLLLLGLLAVAALVVSASASGLAGDSATGRGLSSQSEKFDFSAVGTGLADRANGTVKQNYTITDPDTVVTGTVTCLLIVGKDAYIGGVVRDVRPANGALGIYVGNRFFVNAEDNAKPGAPYDRYQFIQAFEQVPPFNVETGPPESCSEAIPFGQGQPIIKGDIEVVPGP